MTSRHHIRSLNIACLNVRGCKEEKQREIIIEDCFENNIQILAVSETHIGDTGLEEHTKGARKYSLFYSGKAKDSHHGVGLIIDQELKPTFQAINERLCQAEIQLAERKLFVIASYAPTLSQSNKDPEIREEFYNQLQGALNKIPSRHICVVLGDFNAKTGSGWRDFPSVVGRFGKGHINNNGQALVEFMDSNNMVLTNTCFRHKLAHRTTWVAPERFNTVKDENGNARPLLGPDGRPRRQPFRNQIDYVAVKQEHRRFVTDSRSSGNIKTDTDHKMVKMKMKISWYRLKPAKQDLEKRTNMSNFSSKIKQQQYREKVQITVKDDNTPQEQWNEIIEACTDTSREVMGTKQGKKKVSDPEIQQLSKQNHQLKCSIDAATTSNRRTELKTERQQVKNAIRSKLRDQAKEEMEAKLKQLEIIKNDADKYYQALRELKRNKPKETLCVEDDNGSIVGTTKEQVVAISTHFKRMLAPENATSNPKEYPPTPMTTPFTCDEIKKSAQSMKNGKSCGIDNIHAEHIKYASQNIHEGIATILNKTAETGDYPNELKMGILTPLPKPGKRKGPRENLRPIILLSVLRKILTICLIRRTWDRLSTRISRDQAAYQSGRSTTEQVFAIKLLAEKAINASDYTIYILMLDMSKAFDTVDRNKLFEALEEVLLPEELHLLHILTNNVFIKVRVAEELGEAFTTLIGIMQGDCLSAILFIFYLARALTPPKTQLSTEHNYAIENIAEVKWKTYIKEQNLFTISPKYADDTTWASTKTETIKMIKETVPSMLRAFNLHVNVGKTEEFAVPYQQRTMVLQEHNYSKNPGKDHWKKCKLLGSHIDTETDIKRRRALVVSNMKNHKHIYHSKLISLKLKIRHFNCFQESIFLYNCSLWTLTQTLSKSIDAFQRKQLRYALGIVYPKKISNNDLYTVTKAVPWSQTIKQRRLRLLGHICRLPEDTPARQALKEALAPTKRGRGRPKTTWLDLTKKDLIELGICPTADFNNIITLANDRDAWRNRTIKTDLHRGGQPSEV